MAAHHIHNQADAERLRHELLQITERDMVELRSWVPATVVEMERVLGTRLAVKLVNTWPGVMLLVPVSESSHPSGIERRAMLIAVLGDVDAATLCAAWGGEVLVMPVMRSLLREKRQQWLHREFLALANDPQHPASQTRAAMLLSQRLGAAGIPMTTRQIVKAIHRQSGDVQAHHDQIVLFP